MTAKKKNGLDKKQGVKAGLLNDPVFADSSIPSLIDFDTPKLSKEHNLIFKAPTTDNSSLELNIVNPPPASALTLGQINNIDAQFNNRGVLSIADASINLKDSALFNSSSLELVNNDLMVGNQSLFGMSLNKQESELEKMEKKYKKLEEKREKEFEELNKKTKENLEKIDDLKKQRAKDQQLIAIIEKSIQQQRVSHIPAKKVSNGEEKEGVVFDEDSGAVLIFGKIIGELQPQTRHYFLFKIIFDAYRGTVDYKSLAEGVMSSLGKKIQAKTYENYCQTIKSDIGKKSKKISGMIKVYTAPNGKRGYRLVSPKKQKNNRK